MKQRTKKLFTLILVATLIAGMFGMPSQAKTTCKIILSKKSMTAYVGEQIEPVYYVKTSSGYLAKPKGLKATTSNKKTVAHASTWEKGTDKSYYFTCKKPGTVKITYRYKGAKAVLKVKILSSGVRCPKEVVVGGEEFAYCYGKVFISDKFTVKSSNTRILKVEKKVYKEDKEAYVVLKGIRHGKATVTVKTKYRTRKFTVTVNKGGVDGFKMYKPSIQWRGNKVKSITVRVKNNYSNNIRVTNLRLSAGNEGYWCWYVKNPVLVKPGKTVSVTFDNYTLGDGKEMTDCCKNKKLEYDSHVDGYLNNSWIWSNDCWGNGQFDYQDY